MPRARLLAAVAALSPLVLAAPAALATEVWSGRTFVFSKEDFADWTQAANQDRITDNVWITRADTRGLFNVKTELSYTGLSPAGTEWATGNAVDHASLLFQPWVDWAGHNPPGTVGVNAVVHLIPDDVYLDIRINSWTSFGGGGGFSYVRAVKPLTGVDPGPVSFALRGFLRNPATADGPVEFTLPDAAPARLEVFDLSGRLVAARDVGALGAGAHRLSLPELRGQPPGMLFVRLTRDGHVLTARAALLR